MGKSFENERLSYFDVFHGNKTGDGTKHDPEKEVLVADQFLDIAGDHAGEHHAEGHLRHTYGNKAWQDGNWQAMCLN